MARHCRRRGHRELRPLRHDLYNEEAKRVSNRLCHFYWFHPWLAWRGPERGAEWVLDGAKVPRWPSSNRRPAPA